MILKRLLPGSLRLRIFMVCRLRRNTKKDWKKSLINGSRQGENMCVIRRHMISLMNFPGHWDVTWKMRNLSRPGKVSSLRNLQMKDLFPLMYRGKSDNTERTMSKVSCLSSVTCMKTDIQCHRISSMKIELMMKSWSKKIWRVFVKALQKK